MIPKQQPRMIARKAIVLIAAFACLLLVASKALHSSGEAAHALLLRASLVETSSPKQKVRSLNEGKTKKTKTVKHHKESTVSAKPETTTVSTKASAAKAKTAEKETKVKKEKTPTTSTKTKEKNESTDKEEIKAETEEEKATEASKKTLDADEEQESEEANGKAAGKPADSTAAKEKDDETKEKVSQDETDETQQEDEDKNADKKDNFSEKETPDSDDTDKESSVDPCQGATSCSECKVAASNVTLEEKTCTWTGDSCEVVSKDDGALPESMCGNKTTDTAAENTSELDDPDEEGGFLASFMIFMAFIGFMFAIRLYGVHSGASIPGAGSVRPSRGSSRNTEIVPLAGTDDDEWGWDDSGGGDVELSSRAKQQEDEDLRMAMALSLSESPSVPRPKPSGSATRRTNSGSRSTPVSSSVNRSSSASEWDEWDDEAPPVAPTRPAVTAPKPAAVPPKARQTSAPTTRRQAEKPKPKDDDIFASMGLAAKPTFSTGGAKSTQASAPTTSALSAAAEDVLDLETGSNWGDDTDLDDLLDD